MDTFGLKLYNLRKVRGLSQEELANKVGVSRQTIYKWETDITLPNNDNLIILCESLSITKDYFFASEECAITESTISSQNGFKIARKSRLYVFLIVAFAFVDICLAILTICIGFITLTPNVGAVSNIHDLWNSTHFYIFLIITLLLFCVDISMIIIAVRSKINISNRNKEK